jgi:O-acetyl-ADP-ribose deacetylase (regulator of RNase III)
MNITNVTGDAFTHAQQLTVPAFAHGVNTSGVMGAGVAKTVRSHWPALYDTYRNMCSLDLLTPGNYMAWRTPRGGWVYNLATQDAPGPRARLGWVVQAVENMCAHAQSVGVQEIVSVRIGCGIGGLSWTEVSTALQGIPTSVTLIVADGKNTQSTSQTVNEHQSFTFA